MVIPISPELETVLKAQAERRGIPAEDLALEVLRERLLPRPPLEPRDDWERQVLAMGIDCGVSLSNEAVSRDEMYD